MDIPGEGLMLKWDRGNGVGSGLEELFEGYGIRYYTAAKIAELGFTVSTLVDMKEHELEEMMNSLSHIFRWELLVGEKYGIKAAIRAERRRVEDAAAADQSATCTTTRRRHTTQPVDAVSQEGVSELEAVQEVVATWPDAAAAAAAAAATEMMKKKQPRMRSRNAKKKGLVDQLEDEEHDDEEINDHEQDHQLRQREHPFIVTEPGEVARGKKNGLDYLFHLYDQCRHFLIQVQTIAKERGEKCPTKVTNQVFRYAKKAGASYINKPKMRHYVHCYALHCLDEEGSNRLRREYKERGENVGAWRQACYKPLVEIAGGDGNAWDIDAIFNAHPRLAIWYVPTKLRQLCHAHRNNSTTSISITTSAAPTTHLTTTCSYNTTI